MFTTYDTSKRAIRHQFRPISFMFTKGESTQAFTRLFTSTIQAVQTLFGFAIQLCSVANVTENIKRLHKCRSREQFQHLGKLVIHRLRTKFKEEQVATLIENEYLSVPYDCWYVTASGVVCCSPSSRPIEAYWKVVKATKLYKLRVRLDNMMHAQLPNWLYLDATTGLCEPISSYNGGVVPAEIIAAAHEKLNAKAYKKVKGCYYVNSKRAIDETVTNDRIIQDYESSITGKATVRVQLSIENFESKFMNLHKVAWTQEHWRCDCKGFWHGGVCSHSQLVLHLEKTINLDELNAQLPVREKSGRKCKTKSAWHKQGPSPAKKQKSYNSKLAKQAKEIRELKKLLREK
ncbi:hypothetical protein CYMTET_3582 [Cymbomonas tetramitiformis]|uniref:SWIM-type domain-containing protein n=1 Tax=Cymbomonas tetramitiformis TaxID=36881 RepID=A0AAE0LKX6_9CHLO|nr:hypothetical protein CYMTET_3582 [Cymbomonas tetramitiformis]